MRFYLILKTNMNPSNQEIVIQALLEYWKDRPYLRLGQIVSNAFRAHPSYKRNPEPEIQDVFYMPDKHFLEGLDLLAKMCNESKDSKAT